MLDLALKYNENANVDGVLILEHHRKGKLLALREMPNLEMDLYKDIRANLRIGGGDTPPTHIAIGTGTTAVAVSDTAMEAQVGSRGAATRSQITATVPDDASQYVYTFTLASDTDVTEAGLLNASSGGTLCYHRVFTAIPCLEDDTLRVTWRSKST